MILQTLTIESTATSQPALIVILGAAVVLLAVTSLIITCFSNELKGILTGLVLILLAYGGVAYAVLNFSELSQEPQNVFAVESNKTNLISWAEKEYGINFSPSEAETLLGEAGTMELKETSTYKFGTVSTKVEDEPVEVGLLFSEGEYILAEYSEDGTFQKLRPTSK